MKDLQTGVYEQIINRLLKIKLDKVDSDRFYVGQKPIEKSDAISLLSKYLQHLLESAFASIPEEQSAEKSTEFVNSVIRSLGKTFDIDENDLDVIDAGRTILTAVVDRTKCDYPDIGEYLQQVTPVTALSKSTLFFGGSGTVNMQSELNREILSADEICLVVSFIKVSGLNLLINSLRRFTASGRHLRIITTTYTGATDYEAIQRLAALPNTEVRISYDGTQDRLHAKAYIFKRNSGFHTAYIGSSNISSYALKDGKEWNFKATQFELPDILDSVCNSFETYWNDDSFELFVPGRDDVRLKSALGSKWEFPLLDFSALDIMRAKDYQQEILEKLEVEREVHGHYKNLVVAATGTGKTVIAAFDYKRYRESYPDSHFLFIAHRQEILRQAMNTFRLVLDDPNFGDLWDGNSEPHNLQHIFASKDTLINRLDIPVLTENYYDYVVVDEAHHIVASTYVKLITYFKPHILLGLTATPERTDANEDITEFFDGHISAEIRLPAALNAGLLAPFHYYGIPDNVDLTKVKWTSNHYDIYELTKIYTENDYRTGLILHKMEEYLGRSGVHKVRALCFCVSKEHARNMCYKFSLAGLKCDVLTSDDDNRHRNKVRCQLRDGEINYLFVIDMFNEGVDIPEVDTILFLRPTESVTVFLQQFGRGLRKCENKSHLTVLDFVGHSRAEFNYKERFDSLMGRRSQSIVDEIKNGFPDAPFGCKIVLEEKAREEIITNIERTIKSMNKNGIIREIKSLYKDQPDDFSLIYFVRHSKIPLHRIYKDLTWGQLCQMAGIRNDVSPCSSIINFAVKNKWTATNSYSYFEGIKKFVDARFRCHVDSFSDKERRLATMLYYDFYDREGAFCSMQEMFDAFASDDMFIDEINEVLQLLMDGCTAFEKADNSVYAMWNPLRLHGVYTKAQIQAALGFSSFGKKSTSREGVERYKELKMEAMYVDIIKEREVGSTTDYKDFAQSRTLFHWETQSSVGENSQTAKNYRDGVNHMLLFVRQQSVHPELNNRMGYVYLGEVTLESIEGSRPMRIVWRLRTPMSESTYAFACQYKAIG